MKLLFRIIAIFIELIWFLASLTLLIEQTNMFLIFGFDFGGVWEYDNLVMASFHMVLLLAIITAPIVIYKLIKNKPNKWKWFFFSKIYFLFLEVVTFFLQYFFNIGTHTDKFL